MTDLALGQSNGGKGKGRLPEPVERIIREPLQKRFLTKQKRSLAAFHREVAQSCEAQELRVPARNTLALRIADLDPLKATRRREGQDASRSLQGVGGEPPAVTALLEPEGQHYLEIPYRTLSHPAVTLWEQRQALAKLRQQGREQVDESALFRMIGQMREIVTTAQKATRKARRDADCRQHLKASARPDKPVPPETDIADPQADNLPPAKPFDQIEEW